MSTSQSWALRWTGGKSTTAKGYSFLLAKNIFFTENEKCTIKIELYDLDITYKTNDPSTDC